MKLCHFSSHDCHWPFRQKWFSIPTDGWEGFMVDGTEVCWDIHQDQEAWFPMLLSKVTYKSNQCTFHPSRPYLGLNSDWYLNHIDIKWNNYKNAEKSTLSQFAAVLTEKFGLCIANSSWGMWHFYLITYLHISFLFFHWSGESIEEINSINWITP